jgi:parallel beta-helix repeat protein
VGGTTAADRNVIATTGTPVLVETATNTHVEGNYISCDKSGSTPFANGSNSVTVDYGSNNTIGGAAAGAGNVIAASGFGSAVYITEAGDVVQGNSIGVTADVASSLSAGVQYGVAGVSHGGTIIGNVISGAGQGIFISGGDGWVIKGNRIGTDATGTNAIGNGGCGFVAQAGTGTIGGTGPGDGNLIAYSGAQGISLTSDTMWVIEGNSIHDNGGSGIAFNSRCDIASNPPTINDDCDTDPGPNGLQNYPVITHVAISNQKATVTGTLNSTASTTYRVEVFGNPAPENNHHGEGKTFLGATPAITDAGCHATFGPVELPNDAGGRRGLHRDGDRDGPDRLHLGVLARLHLRRRERRRHHRRGRRLLPHQLPVRGRPRAVLTRASG